MTLTLRHPVHSEAERKNTLKRRFYRTGQFARKAAVTVRTLRYYDKVGLLSPTRHADSGYRLYAEEDLLTLQHILALKFLNFSLEEISLCLRQGPRQFGEMLARQREMLQQKRTQIDAILKAIQRAEALIAADMCDLESVVRVIQVMQMEQKKEWVKKYFNDDQLQKMEELSTMSYSEEARLNLEQRGEWTEEDQKRADEQWRHVASEARRLAAAGADPAGDEAQAVAKLKTDLLSAFTQGDPEVKAGLERFWENVQALPQQERPFDMAAYSAGDAGEELLGRAMTIYQERQQQAHKA